MLSCAKAHKENGKSFGNNREMYQVEADKKYRRTEQGLSDFCKSREKLVMMLQGVLCFPLDFTTHLRYLEVLFLFGERYHVKK